jgi:hypothetical protein
MPVLGANKLPPLSSILALREKLRILPIATVSLNLFMMILPTIKLLLMSFFVAGENSKGRRVLLN